MDVKKIGIFLAQLRKEQNLTQEQLGEKLGVTNKTVSRWENGNYLPPVEMLQELSGLYSVSINEILSGERLEGEDYREKAEENIKSALDNSAFTLKEKISFYKKKWTKDHIASTVFCLVVIIAIYVLGIARQQREWMFTAIGLGFVFYILRYNVMMAYVEGKAFDIPDMKRSEEEVSAKKVLMMKRMRISLMLILAVSVLITVDLAYNYFFSLMPEMNDGITLRGWFTSGIFGDDGWSRAAFFEAFINSLRVTGLLTAGNLVLACLEKRKEQ